MARSCTICVKKPSVGHLISYSNRKTKRRFLPNLIKKRIWFAPAKTFIEMRVCTRCLRTLNKKM